MYIGAPQEVEFTIENGILYLLQSRDLLFDNNISYLKIITDLNNKGIINNYTELFEQFIFNNFDLYIINNDIIKSNDLIYKLKSASGITKIINSDKILFKERLYNSDLDSLTDYDAVIALNGSMTSHSSLLCRNLNMPYLISDGKYIKLKPNTQYIIDGIHGYIINYDLSYITYIKNLKK
jgi:phosphohistidine swiveling domain-containing protein